MRSALSLPPEIIRRRAAALIELSGKANRAAISRRNGVCGVTAPGAGIWMLHITGVVVQNLFGRPESVAACSSLRPSFDVGFRESGFRHDCHAPKLKVHLRLRA